jgi:phenylacetate-CoA ligase
MVTDVRLRIEVAQLPELAPLRWDREQITAHQESMISEFVSFAYERSELTRTSWDRAGVHPNDVTTLAEFVERAPFVTAAEVRDVDGGARDPFRRALCVPVHELTVVGTTSGTTGLPQALPQHAGDIREHARFRGYAINGVGPGSRVLLTGGASRSGHLVDRFDRLGACGIYLDGDESSVADIIDAVRTFKPMHWRLLSTPLLFALTAYERERAADLTLAFASIDSAIWGGDRLGASGQATMERWGLAPRLQTSLGNTCAAVECWAHDGAHVWEDLVIAECLDLHTGLPVGDGQRGELVTTSLGDRAAPVVRYRSGDIVEMTRETCACGIAHARMWTIGRIADEVRVGVRSVLPVDVWEVVETVPATSQAVFQIVRSASTDGVLAVRIGYDASMAGSESSLQGELERRLHDSIGVPVAVHLQPASKLMSRHKGVKLPRVVDS